MSQNWTPPPQPFAPASGSPQMNYALWADRVIAFLADAAIALLVMIVLYALLFVISMVFGAINAAGQQTNDAGIQAAGGLLGCSGCCLFFVLPPVSYFVAGLVNKTYLVSKRGSSIGQGLMKLKVVDANGNLLTFGTALIRLGAQVGLQFVPVVGAALDLLWPLWDQQRQTLHDKAVGSFVIKTV